MLTSYFFSPNKVGSKACGFSINFSKAGLNTLGVLYFGVNFEVIYKNKRCTLLKKRCKNTSITLAKVEYIGVVKFLPLLVL
jgi:hypothetical protein